MSRTKLLVLCLVVFLVFPFPVFQTSYKNRGSACANVPEGYDGCNDVITAIYSPGKYDHIVQIRNIVPGYIVDEQLRECAPGRYYPLDKCLDYSKESFYTYAPYYSLVVPFVASCILYVFARKRWSDG